MLNCIEARFNSMKTLLLILISIISITGCQFKSIEKRNKIILNTPPPGTTKLSDNLFIDQNEITNFNWLEYMYWTEKVYGKNSKEYSSILPDTNVWSKLNKSFSVLDTLYFRHTAYKDYPVVGLSYEQVLNFTKWRSDRVMELFLIKNKILTYNENQDNDSYFSIEKYFTGNYCGIIPDSTLLIYPEYKLPDSVTFNMTISFAESLNEKNYKSCKKKRCIDFIIDSNCLGNNHNNPLQTNDPLSITYCYWCKKDLITHLKGNLREMTNIKGNFFGLSFKDSCQTNFNLITEDTSLVNCYTGFRNSCSYKIWQP